MRTVREVSAGGVIYRRRDDQVEVALIHTGKRWGLPKGHVEAGERVEETAVREVREETGLLGKLDRKLGQIAYTYRGKFRNGRPIRVAKRVTFFLLEYVEGEVHSHDYEVEEARWFALDEAYTKLSFATEQKMMRRARRAIETGRSQTAAQG
ncbi:MAG: NUDIX hydrolase [Deltaproteobacteria bacterium]|nr:NUDIX hydrolase [Deltaproteobacteria bacterium]